MTNRMCKDCARLGIDCKGTEKQVYSGCIYKEGAQQTLRRLLEGLERLEETTSHANDEMVADPENEEKEKASDKAYKAEWNVFMAVADMVVKMTGGQVDGKTARTMVRTKRNEVLSIVALATLKPQPQRKEGIMKKTLNVEEAEKWAERNLYESGSFMFPLDVAVRRGLLKKVGKGRYEIAGDE